MESPKRYRPNVAAVVVSAKYPFQCQLFIASRSDIEGAWQFPQGGIDEGETPREALYRELEEEIGTGEVEIIAEWALYDSNPQQVEYRLHKFFHEQRLNMTLKVGNQEYKPNEWFDVDLVNIEKALQLIFQGKINEYQFDSASKTILPLDYT